MAEGLTASLKRHEAILERSDAVLVVTDGDIGGAPIPHAAYKKRGMVIVGGYVNSEGIDHESVIKDMQAHFTRLLVRNTVEGLLDAMVLQPLER